MPETTPPVFRASRPLRLRGNAVGPGGLYPQRQYREWHSALQGQHLPVQRRWARYWMDRRFDDRGEGRRLRASAPERLSGCVRSGPLWLCPGHYERRRPLVTKRTWRRSASEGQARGADAESGRRRSRDHYEAVIAARAVAPRRRPAEALFLLIERVHRGNDGAT